MWQALKQEKSQKRNDVCSVELMQKNIWCLQIIISHCLQQESFSYLNHVIQEHDDF